MAKKRRFGRRVRKGIRIGGLGFSGNLLAGKLPTKGPVGLVSTGINIGLAYFSGILFGNGVQSIAAATPIIGTIGAGKGAQVLGALAAFSTGGFAGLAGFVIAGGLLAGTGLGAQPTGQGA